MPITTDMVYIIIITIYIYIHDFLQDNLCKLVCEIVDICLVYFIIIIVFIYIGQL